MNRILKYALVAAACAGGVVLVARAQVPAAPVAKTAAPTTVPATAPTTPATVPVPSPPAAPAAVSPERFEPTDKVRADFDVSFPIDI